MRELEILCSNARENKVDARYFGLHAGEAGVTVTQGDKLDDIGSITALDESLMQSDRFLEME
ncbi:hypothetical protein FPK44_24975 [Acinetobacter baumannii]|nr:hypothetical protein [Acinetobacter baumannii]MDT1883735.1 hypothetical protein [Acinetobacter baumannii]